MSTNKDKIIVTDWLFDSLGVATDYYDGDLAMIDNDLKNISHDNTRQVLNPKEVNNLMNWMDSSSNIYGRLKYFDTKTKNRISNYTGGISKEKLTRDLCLGLLTLDNQKLLSDQDLEKWANSYGFKEIMLKVIKCNQLGFLPVEDDIDSNIMVRIINLKKDDNFRDIVCYYIKKKQSELLTNYQTKGWDSVLRIFKLDQYL